MSSTLEDIVEEVVGERPRRARPRRQRPARRARAHRDGRRLGGRRRRHGPTSSPTSACASRRPVRDPRRPDRHRLDRIPVPGDRIETRRLAAHVARSPTTAPTASQITGPRPPDVDDAPATTRPAAMTAVQLAHRRPHARRQRLLRRRRVRPDLRAPQPDRAARRRPATAARAPCCGASSTCPRCWPPPSWASRCPRSSSAPSPNQPSPICWSRCSRRSAFPSAVIHPIVVRRRARRGDVSAHADRRDDPQERRARRPGTQPPTGSSHRSVAVTRALRPVVFASTPSPTAC